jgi:hypothetical protein
MNALLDHIEAVLSAVKPPLALICRNLIVLIDLNRASPSRW